MSNTEYPKMLYTGDKEQYSCRAVQDADEEKQYRENGLVDYADLPDPEPALNPYDPNKEGEAPQGFITTEQFDAVAERLASAEAEIERLKQSNISEVGQVVGDTAPKIDYSTLTTAQLQEALAEKGIEFKVRDSKAELLALLEA